MKYMNNEHTQRKLKDIQCFVLDMDGTFNLGGQLIPGAMDFYHKAIETGRRVLFLTNNSSRDGAHYVKKMNNLGCPVTAENIYTSGMATCQYLCREHVGKAVYLLGNNHLAGEFRRYGIELEEDDPDMVVVGFDTTLDYARLCKVCDFIREGRPYIATHPDYNCPTETGFIPDIGAIMALIEASTGRKADTIVGKPYEEIARGLMEMTDLPKEAIAIVGDRLYTDIATGVNFDLLSILVLSGESSMEDVEASDVQPDLIYERLGDMTEYL